MPRWDVMIFANAENKLDEASEAIGFPVVGIIDERRGGIVAYASEEVADEIVQKLNANP
jgi:CheY-specific phosphatase CheX